MKKKVIIAIASMLVFGQGAWAQTTSFTVTETENGTKEKPFLIESVEDLNALASDVNSGNSYEGKYFKLTAEDGLDYSGKTFTPIGYGDNTDGKPFSGTFDGSEKTISGITVNKPEVWGVGLFGYISKATIKNVTITNSSFTATGFVGAIAGCSDKVNSDLHPIIENCHVTNSVSVNATDYAAGGIIGIDNDNLTIKDCTSAATISSTDVGVGGIIGVAYEDPYMATIIDSYYLGNLPAIGENGGHNDGIEKYATINITLLNDDRNATVKNATRIANYEGENANVTLDGRTLYKDSKWNTLCLPFGLTSFTGTPFEGATVKALTSSAFDNETDELTLNFTEDANNLTIIEAGKPYIVKWTGTDVSNPVFSGVTITNSQNTTTSTAYVDFVGSFSPVSLTANYKNLYLGADNTLYYPSSAMYVNACRAVFQLKGSAAGGNAKARSFVLNFGESSEETGISPAEITEMAERANAWYSLDGRRLGGKPTRKGVYVNNGRKVVVK